MLKEQNEWKKTPQKKQNKMRKKKTMKRIGGKNITHTHTQMSMPCFWYGWRDEEAAEEAGIEGEMERERERKKKSCVFFRLP